LYIIININNEKHPQLLNANQIERSRAETYLKLL